MEKTLLRKIEVEYQRVINRTRQEKRTETDFNRKTELGSYVKGLEEALKILRGHLYKNK